MKFFGLKDVLATSGGHAAKSTDGTDSRSQHEVIDSNRGSTAATHRFELWPYGTDGRTDGPTTASLNVPHFIGGGHKNAPRV